MQLSSIELNLIELHLQEDFKEVLRGPGHGVQLHGLTCN